MGKKQADAHRPLPSARAAVRPRRNTAVDEYDMTTHGDTASGSMFDRSLTREWSNQVKLIRPSWEGELPLVFKPTPAVDPNDLESFLPARRSADDGDFTNWFRVMPGIKYVGTEENSKLTCILYDKRWLKKGYDPATQNPYFVLHSAVRDVVGDSKWKKPVDDPVAMLGRKNVLTPKWFPAFKKGMNCLPKNHFAYFQGGVFQLDREVYIAGKQPPLGYRDDDQPALIVLQSNTAIDAVKALLNERVREKVDPHDVNGQFVVGDPTELSAGRLLCLYNPKVHKPKVAFLLGEVQEAATAVEGSEEDVAYDEPEEGSDKKKGGYTGWAAVATDKLYFTNKFGQRKKIGPDISQYEDRVRANYLWWDDVLHVPSTEELALWLAKAFVSLPNMLRFAWQENQEFFTDEVKGALSARVVVPGARPEPEEAGDEDDEDAHSGGDRRRSRKAPPVDVEDEDDADLDEDLGTVDAEADLGDIDDVDADVDADSAAEFLDDDEEAEAIDDLADEEDADDEAAGDDEEESEDVEGFEDDEEPPPKTRPANTKAERVAQQRSAQRHSVPNYRADEEDASMAAKSKKTAPAAAKKPTAKKGAKKVK